MSMAQGIFQMKNMPLFIATILILIVLLINLVTAIIGLFKKRRTQLFSCRSWLSVMAILVFIGLTYLVITTSGSDQFLLLFGLPTAANWLFILSVFFIFGTIWYLVQLGKTMNRTTWNMISGITYVLFAVGIILFRLYPSFS